MELSFCMYLASRCVEVGFEARHKSFYGFWDILEKPPWNSSKVSGVSRRRLPWRSIAYRGRSLSSASYLKIARWRSALWSLRAGAAQKSQNSWFSWFLHPGLIQNNLVAPRKVVSRMMIWSWAFACTSLEGVSRWALKLLRNVFADSEIFLKNHPKIILKSAGCRGAVCPGGVLLMWGGAVNRQPGYRARNLQRRGFSSAGRFPEYSRMSLSNS